jgi:hypothetical protein
VFQCCHLQRCVFSMISQGPRQVWKWVSGPDHTHTGSWVNWINWIVDQLTAEKFERLYQIVAPPWQGSATGMGQNSSKL